MMREENSGDKKWMDNSAHPGNVTRYVSPIPCTKQNTSKTELAKHCFESVAFKLQLPAGRVEVEANKLHPVHVEGGESIYAPIPVSLSVELDARGRVKSIDGGTP